MNISSFGKKVNKTADNLWKFACMWQNMTFLWFSGLLRFISINCEHHKLSKSYNFYFFIFRGMFWAKICFQKRFLTDIFFHCGWSWCFLMMFSQSSNGHILKSFNLKGKSWENKILRMAEVGENISSFGKKGNKTADNWWKFVCMWQIMTFLWFWGLVYCYFTYLGTTSCQNHTIFHFFIFRGMFWAKIVF